MLLCSWAPGHRVHFSVPVPCLLPSDAGVVVSAASSIRGSHFVPLHPNTTYLPLPLLSRLTGTCDCAELRIVLGTLCVTNAVRSSPVGFVLTQALLPADHPVDRAGDAGY